jgi:NAD(P)H dehydrogenase (quinone)
MGNCTNDFESLTGKKPKSVRVMFSNMKQHEIGKRTATD